MQTSNLKASLVTPSLLNFPVVLRQDIVQNYDSSEEETLISWKFSSIYCNPSETSQASVSFLINLNKLYEKGNVNEFFQFFDKNNNVIKIDQNLENSKELLVRKIRVVSLCDSIFFSKRNSNTISFAEISEIVGIPLEDVELLIIHVLSIKLLTGQIDEEKEQLIIESIKPRELDDFRLIQLKNKYDSWQENISGALDFIKNC